MQSYTYTPQGVCSMKITFDINLILKKYDILANNVNNLMPEKRAKKALYRKTTSFQKLPITVKKMNGSEINDYYNKDINGFNCITINRSTNNKISMA